MDEKETAREQLIAEIERVFDGVSREDGITLHEADAIDVQFPRWRRRLARWRDRERRWQDVPDRVIEGGHDSLAHFDAKGLRYYLPAFLRWTLRHGDKSSSCSSDFTFYTLIPGDGILEAYFYERIAGFTEDERRTICRFLRYVVRFSEFDSDAVAAQEALDGYWGQFCETATHRDPNRPDPSE